MDNFSPQPAIDAQQPGGFFASFPIAATSRRIINWLAGIVELTEEEEQDAGIYYQDRQPYE